MGRSQGWWANALMATVVHGVMVAGLQSGIWDASACIVGILLDSLAAYVLWLVVYLKLAREDSDARMLAKSFIGLSFGVWGFIAMFRAITLRDTAFFAMQFAVLKYLDLGDALDAVGSIDGDGILFILVLLAAALLLVSLYFLAQILFAMPLADVAMILASVAVLRGLEMFNFRHRHSADKRTAQIDDAGTNLAELCLHVFVKGWVGALMMVVLGETPGQMVWIYLAWSYAHDLLLRTWVWRRLGPRLGLARADSLQTGGA